MDNGRGVHTRMVMSRLQVWVPFNPKFVEFCRDIEGARWKKRSNIWSFHSYDFPKVAKALNEIYGTSIKLRQTKQVPGA